jgi:LmbE family N-acetylglucosaminyl deacetylase
MTPSSRRSIGRKSKILVVCAHPDDETLGLGGTLALEAANGNDVFVLIFTHGQFGRDVTSAGIKRRQEQAKKACSVLGVNEIKFLNYEDEKLDTIPTVDLACQIEKNIRNWKPDTIFTHYWGDLNQDHRRVFESTLIASRPTPSSKINRLVCFETPSSTEWGYSPSGFNPNSFVCIDSMIKKKTSALKMYGGEISSYPHPRSIESVLNRSKYWGSSIGVKHAEAFMTIREIVR